MTVEFGEGDDKISLDTIAERAKKYQPKPKITYKMIQKYVKGSMDSRRIALILRR